MNQVVKSEEILLCVSSNVISTIVDKYLIDKYGEIKQKTLFIDDNSKEYRALSYLLTHRCLIEEVKRSVAEGDPRYRQLVANVIIKQGDNYVFTFRKSKSNIDSDARLNGTIGMIGGHENSEDSNRVDSILRELSEEISFSKDIKLKGVIQHKGYILSYIEGISSEHICDLFILEVDEDIDIVSKDLNEPIVKLSSKDILNNKKSNLITFKTEYGDAILDDWASIAIENII